MSARDWLRTIKKMLKDENITDCKIVRGKTNHLKITIKGKDFYTSSTPSDNCRSMKNIRSIIRQHLKQD